MLFQIYQLITTIRFYCAKKVIVTCIGRFEAHRPVEINWINIKLQSNSWKFNCTFLVQQDLVFHFHYTLRISFRIFESLLLELSQPPQWTQGKRKKHECWKLRWCDCCWWPDQFQAWCRSNVWTQKACGCGGTCGSHGKRLNCQQWISAKSKWACKCFCKL